MANYAVILLAAGQSSRFKDREKKPFANLDGRAVWLRSLELVSIRDNVKQILIVISAEDEELFERRYRANVAFLANATVIMGGAERADSVQNALSHCDSSIDFVVIHDTARPCVTAEMWDAACSAAEKSGAAILACPVADTLKRAASDHTIQETVPRTGLWQAQTPQVFRRQLIVDAYVRRNKVAGAITDDAQLVEALGHKVTLVESDLTNVKITNKRDLALAEAIIKSRPKPKDKLGLHPFGDENMWR